MVSMFNAKHSDNELTSAWVWKNKRWLRLQRDWNFPEGAHGEMEKLYMEIH